MWCTYIEVDCEGHHQQLCIDHLLPAVRTSTTGPQKTVVSDIPPEASDRVEPVDSFRTPGPTDNDQSTPGPLILLPHHKVPGAG